MSEHQVSEQVKSLLDLSEEHNKGVEFTPHVEKGLDYKKEFDDLKDDPVFLKESINILQGEWEIEKARAEQAEAELEEANWKLLRMIDRCNEAIETDEVAQGTSRQNWLTWLVFEWKAQKEGKDESD